MIDWLSDWWDQYNDLVSAGCIFILAIAIVSAGCYGVMAFSEYQNCNERIAIDPDREYHWDWFTGCLVKTNSGLWIAPSDIDKILLDEDK